MSASSAPTYRIGQLARLTGASVPTIRFYEQQGLLGAALRQANGQRIYGAEDVSALQFIRRARSFDFPLPAIRRLLDLRGDVNCTCDGLLDFGKRQLQELRDKLVALQALEQELAGMVSSCESTCYGGPIGDCTITVRLDAASAQAVAQQIKSRRR